MTPKAQVKRVHLGTASIAATATVTNIPAASWEVLSATSRAKFANAGMRESARTAAQAQEFLNASIPEVVKNLGEEAVKEFLAGKHASHIQSVKNSPALTQETINILWENGTTNLARGAQDMNYVEQIVAHSHNTFDAVSIVAKNAAFNAARGASFASLLEAPVSIAENTIKSFTGQISVERAVSNVVDDVTSAAVTGAISGVAATGIVAVGGGAILSVASPILVPSGIGCTTISAVWRIREAWLGMPSSLKLSKSPIFDLLFEIRKKLAQANWQQVYQALAMTPDMQLLLFDSSFLNEKYRGLVFAEFKEQTIRQGFSVVMTSGKIFLTTF